MKRWIGIFTICLATLSWGQRSMPSPAGRWVVDDANILSPATESMLTQLLQQHEDSTSNQVVVLTITSLEGESIEAYANRVFNEWKIGQEGRNNGVLLLVAKVDRKVRIEVGYGLEPDLTDLESKSIIDHEIVPEFKKGNFDQGVTNGVTAILAAIQGTYQPVTKRSKDDNMILLIFGGIFLVMFLVAAKTKGVGGYLFAGLMTFGAYTFLSALGGTLFWLMMGGLLGFFALIRTWTWKRNSWWKSGRTGGAWYGGSGGWGSGGGWGGGGGGFSGGGGSSGGGGASGGW